MDGHRAAVGSLGRKPCSLIPAAIATFGATARFAQSGSKPSVPGLVTSGENQIIPYPSFQAGGFHRFFLGNNWRALWLRPVPVKVLNLEKTAGGLVVVDRGEGHQSRPFDFKAPDGTQFGFRVLVKDATLDWPASQRTKVLTKLAHEQISGTVPGGALAVGVIERAVGVARAPLELVLLPDHHRLGFWRAEYAGKPGTIEVRLQETEDSPDNLPPRITCRPATSWRANSCLSACARIRPARRTPGRSLLPGSSTSWWGTGTGTTASGYGLASPDAEPCNGCRSAVTGIGRSITWTACSGTSTAWANPGGSTSTPRSAG